MPELMPSRILWFAFVVTQVLFAGVGTFFFPGAAPADPVVVGGVVVMGLPGLALVALAPRLFGKMPAANAWLVKYAACESVGMFGLAVHGVGGPTAVALGMHGLSILALLTQFPTAERFTRWEIDRLGGGQQ